MQKTRLPLVMLLGLAALTLLSGCAGAAPTPTQAMREAEGQVPAQPVELSATPTPTPTPEPTATPTETSTPTPEATPTPDAEAIVQRIQEKLSQEQQVYRNDMWRYESGSRACKNILIWGNLKLTEALGINYDLAQLVKQGHDVRIVWVGKNWWYPNGAYPGPLSGEPVFCLLPDIKYTNKRNRFVAGEVIPLNSSASYFLDDKGLSPSKRFALSSGIFGWRSRSARGGEIYDVQTEHYLAIIVDQSPVAAVHLRTVEDHNPEQFREIGDDGKFNIFIKPIQNIQKVQNYTKQCSSISSQ